MAVSSSALKTGEREAAVEKESGVCGFLCCLPSSLSVSACLDSPFQNRKHLEELAGAFRPPSSFRRDYKEKRRGSDSDSANAFETRIRKRTDEEENEKAENEEKEDPPPPRLYRPPLRLLVLRI